MKMFSLLEDLSNKFNGQIPNLIYFAIGIGLGIILFLITSLIVFIISKSKVSIEKQIVDVKIREEYKAVIQAKKDEFTTIYKNSTVSEKVSGILRILVSMLEEISTIYYPDSEDPMFEVSIERLVDLIDYLIHRINLIVDEMIIDRLHIVEVVSKMDIKNTKLSKVFELLNKKQPEEKLEPERKTIFSKVKANLTKGVKKVGVAITGGIVNYTFYNIIDDLGEDINKLYSNQPLIFTDISKKEEKRRRKEEKKNKKRKVGDDYA